MVYQAERFASFLKKDIAQFLDRSVPRASGVIFSVTSVAVDPGGERAQVFISVFPEKFGEETFRTLKRFEGETRAYVSDHLKRRKIPALIFVRDMNQAAQVRLEKLLENIDDTK